MKNKVDNFSPSSCPSVPVILSELGVVTTLPPKRPHRREILAKSSLPLFITNIKQFLLIYLSFTENYTSRSLGQKVGRYPFRTMVDLVDRIYVMLEQESRFYLTTDYLAPEFQENLTPFSEIEVDDAALRTASANASSSASGSSCSSGINETWREKICEWSYQVIDHFDFSREVVTVSISYLDRYLATRSVTKKMFQLAAMTSLFIAIKLYEPGRLSIPSMIELSRGYFMVEQMAAMELSILR